MTSTMELPPNWQPSDVLTTWDYDDISVWGLKTRIDELSPDDVKKMWALVLRYRQNIRLEEERAEAFGSALSAHVKGVLNLIKAHDDEVRRVLEVNGVDSAAIYDAFHNASIITRALMRQIGDTPEVSS